MELVPKSKSNNDVGERADAQRSLREAMERSSVARQQLLQLESGFGAGAGSATEHELAVARHRLADAQAAVARKQAEEEAHEAVRPTDLFSERKPYPGCTDLAPVASIAAHTLSMSR